MNEVVSDVDTTSEKIRMLLKEGYLRTDVAKFLGIRYQHVRKVAVDAGILGGLQRGVVVLPKSTPVPRAGPEASFKMLIDAGFRKVSTWIADGSDGIALAVPVSRDPGVYAFIVDTKVKYIGLTRSGFRSRMANYRAGQKGQRTSARVNEVINHHISNGNSVEVYVVSPPQMEWNGLPVVTAAGLEAGLIKMIQPEWNKMGIAKAP